MKKITLFLGALILTLVIQAQITLTHNTDNVITSGNSVACGGGDNLQARVFNLADFGVSSDFEITEGEIGVQSISADLTVTVNIYQTTGSFPTDYPDSYTLLGTQDVLIPLGSDETIVSYTFTNPVVIPAGTAQIIVEVAQPTADGITWFLGGTAAEDDDSWLLSVECGLPDYGTTAGIGFPDAHYYITVTGNETLAIEDNNLEGVIVTPNPTVNILNVTVPLGVEIESVKLFDILGRDTSLTFNNGTFNTSKLAQGVYILSLKTAQGNYTTKVVKK